MWPHRRAGCAGRLFSPVVGRSGCLCGRHSRPYFASLRKADGGPRQGALNTSLVVTGTPGGSPGDGVATSFGIGRLTNWGLLVDYGRLLNSTSLNLLGSAMAG